MMKPEDVDSGVRAMAKKLRELVLRKEVFLKQGPKRIFTARINLGSTEGFFDQVLEYALGQGMVYKVIDDFLTIHPPESEVSTVQMKMEGVEPI